jgi:hypothetical protein
MNKTLLAFLLSMIVHPAIADSVDVTNQFAKCSIIKLDASRLKCYDQVRDDVIKNYRSQQSAPKTTYQPIDLLDLKTDFKSMYGSKVLVTGYIQMVGEVAQLQSNSMDMTPLVVNIMRLPREDRKKLINGCSMCGSVNISGIATSSNYGNTILAEQISWN